MRPTQVHRATRSALAGARRGRVVRTLAVALVLAVAVGCSGSGDGSDGAAPDETTDTSVVEETPTLVAGDCWWEVPADAPEGVTVTCGSVDVPADRTDPETDMVTLAVARLHGPEGDPDAEPVLVLHGGPGGDALGGFPAGLARNVVLEERDVILFDQRGVGRSTPSLNCPEKEDAVLDALGTADPFKDELDANRAAVVACRDRLVAEGIDLDDYDSLASVADIESLRTAFDVERWNLYGGSYGTRLGLAYARVHPDQVRSLAIDSVYGPEVGAPERVAGLPREALERLVTACADDEGCTTAFGDLGARLDEAAAALDASPETATLAVDVNGEQQERTFTVTGGDMRGGLYSALYQNDLIPVLPSIIDSLATGDRSVVTSYIGIGIPLLVGLSEGAYFSVDCADAGRLLDGTDFATELPDDHPDGLVAIGLAQVYCDVWDVEPLPEDFNEPALPDVPTLVLGGTLDPVTPYDGSRAQAEAMPDARMVSVPRGGHGAASFDDCTVSALTTFWSDPAADLPACVEAIEPLPFTVPAG